MMLGPADKFLIAGIVLLILIVAARWVTGRAMKLLEPEDKVKLVDLFSGQRTYNLLLIIFLLVGYYAVVKMQLIELRIGLLIYFGALIAIMLVSINRSLQKLKDANIPDFYQKAYIQGSVLRLVGLLGLLIASLI